MGPKALYLATPIAFPPSLPPTEGFPWDDFRKIFRGCQRMAKVPNSVETLPKISTGCVGRTNVTDRQTTDGPATAFSKRELTRSLKWTYFNILIILAGPQASMVLDTLPKPRFVCSFFLLSLYSTILGLLNCSN